MDGLWIRIFAALCVLGAGFAAPAAAQASVRVTDVRFGGTPDNTRIVIDSDKPLKYHVFLLEAGSRRIVVDLPRVRWSIGGLTTESGTGDGSGLVGGYRFAHNTADTSRLVLDLAEPALISREFQLAPKSTADRHRIVMDLKRATAADFAHQAGLEHNRPKAAPQRVSRKPLVVIDPGHGGKDPGASSPSGVREKDITLGVALALRDELLRLNRYDVALTRSTDVFIELEDRVTRARDLGADLFISLHADAGPKPDTRGASVYTLSIEGEKRAEEARQEHNWVLAVEADSSRSQVVNQILADLVQRETKNQSARFAQILVPALAEAGWPALRNTHRRKGFYVLLGPDVPAVLLEMGFITNKDDAVMLGSEAHRRKLVKGVAGAIDAFFDSQTSLVARR